VLAVVGLLAVGGILASVEGVQTLVSSRQVREVTTALRNLPLPPAISDWSSACGTYGVVCARSDEPPQVAAEIMAERLRELGHEVEPVRCGDGARIDPGTTLATYSRHESQCTTTTDVPGGVLTVAAWDFVPASTRAPDEGMPVGTTAVVVEWDSEGTEQLFQAEPEAVEARFGDVRITPEELAALPSPLSEAECLASDVDGCQSYEAVVEGPGEHRELVEAWAGRLFEAGFLLTTVECSAEAGEGPCRINAELGRAGGETTRIFVGIVVDRDSPGIARAMIFTV